MTTPLFNLVPDLLSDVHLVADLHSNCFWFLMFISDVSDVYFWCFWCVWICSQHVYVFKHILTHIGINCVMIYDLGRTRKSSTSQSVPKRLRCCLRILLRGYDRDICGYMWIRTATILKSVAPCYNIYVVTIHDSQSWFQWRRCDVIAFSQSIYHNVTSLFRIQGTH